MKKTETLIEMIKRHEGLRLKPYRDTVGILTIGYGRNLEDVGISEDEAELMLQNDIAGARKRLEEIFTAASTLSGPRYNVLVDMIFNLGPGGFMGFRKMRKAVEEGDFERAAQEMLDSKWAVQVKGRAEELARMMRQG